MNRATSFVIVFFLLGVAVEAMALPKFAARTGAKCQSCHVNPTGKGMRLEFGQTYGRDDITLPTFKAQTDYEEFSTALTSNLSIGGDFRNIFQFESKDNSSSFFQMQGDVYFDFRLNKKFRIYFDKGLYSGFELMGIAKVLPLEGYVKVGKFMPAYGTRIDDHNAYIRGGPFGGMFVGPYAALSSYPAGLKFGERSEDTGIELGFAPSIFTLNIGFFNGTPGSGISGISTSKDKTFALRGDATFKISETVVNLGGSYYNSPSGADRQTFYGAFGSIGLFEALSLHGEIDFLNVRKSGSTTNGFMLWTEANYMVVQGVDLKVGYQFYDPDREIANGS
ncbi:MAG: hypothetical protein HY966_03925, partial [Ignavibacteriales bacterium]|nr:hypothetical protein [Ignavibacteriales bacterium]